MGAVRGSVERFLARRQCPQRQRDSTALVLSELVTNAAMHGGGGPIDVAVTVDEDASVNVEVANRAEGVDLGPPSSWVAPPPDAVTGRGLAVVAALAQRIDHGVVSGRLVVRATIGPDG